MPSPNTTLTLRRPAGVKAFVGPAPLPAPAPAQEANRGQEPAPPVSSESLLKGATHLHIVHNGALYQLRATRLGKLILTK